MPNRATVEKMIDQPAGPGVWTNCPGGADPDISRLHTFQDDFFQYDATSTVGNWAVAGDSAAPVLTDAAGGVLSIPTSAGTDNHQSILSSIAENWLFASNKKLWFEARVKLTEAATDDANIIVGLSDTVAADFIQDNGAGPAASYDGAVFCKVDGGTVWQFETSNATSQNTTASAGAFTSGAWTRLGFYFDGAGQVTPYINGAGGTPLDLTLTGLAEMHLVLGVKNGGGNVETLLVDYVKVKQLR